MFRNLGCVRNCGSLLSNEWYLYVFELGPMLIFTYWLNLLHPGRFLPRHKSRYLSSDGLVERIGPGWIDRRDRWEIFVYPLGIEGTINGQPSHEEYWLLPEEWSVCEDGSFAEETASNKKIDAEGIGFKQDHISAPVSEV